MVRLFRQNKLLPACMYSLTSYAVDTILSPLRTSPFWRNIRKYLIIHSTAHLFQTISNYTCK